MTWDLTSPADTDPIRQGASVIRAFKQDVQTALQVEHVFPGANPASPVLRWKPRRDVVGNRPANDNVNPGTVFIATDLNEIEVDTGTAWIPVGHVIPPGAIMAYPASSPPGGWLVCDGSAVSRTTYAVLFAIIGTSHGSGDGSTTFNLPDYRGRFLRMVDGTAARDPDRGSRSAMNTGGQTGNNIGSVQGAATAIPAAGNWAVSSAGAHHHQYHRPIFNAGNQAGSNTVPWTIAGGEYASTGNPEGTDEGAHTHTISGGDNETRPINAYVNYIIKT